MIVAIQHRMQTLPDFVVVSTLVMISSLIGSGCGIRPRQHDNWEVIPNLWAGCVSPPSTLKSPADFYRYELPTASLKKHGWNEGGLCPFHDDRKAGSFRVNLDTGAFTCYACNTKGGDIVAFVMNQYALTLPRSLTQDCR